MTVKELIEELKKMPQDANVYHLWDGDLRTEVNIVYKAKNGKVVTSDFNEVCYYKENRPLDLLDDNNKYWHTKEDPNN